MHSATSWFRTCVVLPIRRVGLIEWGRLRCESTLRQTAIITVVFATVPGVIINDTLREKTLTPSLLLLKLHVHLLLKVVDLAKRLFALLLKLGLSHLLLFFLFVGNLCLDHFD